MSSTLSQLMHSLFRRVPVIAYAFIPVIRMKDRIDGSPMHQRLDTSIERFCPRSERDDVGYICRLKRDMWYSFLRYNCGFDEYFLFQFPNHSHCARLEFISDIERAAICKRMVSPEMMSLFKNKWNTYQRLQPFYCRDVILVNSETTPSVFFEFIAKHPVFMAKPLAESCGRGIRRIDTATEPDLNSLFQQLQQETVLLEDLIEQVEELSCLHPSSVNTVRCATFLKDETVHILFAFLRIGQHNSVVDNGGAGGLFSSIDVKTGITYTPAFTEYGTSFLVHPDTNVKLMGLNIPRWEDLLQLVCMLAREIPSQKYISWDLALTNNGWVVVEANCMGQFICPQITTGNGLRKHLSPYFDL